MAFKKAAHTKASLPFFDEWTKELTHETKNFLDGKQIAPLEIRKVRSKKGFMLIFDDQFSIFTWRNSSDGVFLRNGIKNETMFLPVILFKWLGQSFDYDMGCDDEIEVALTEDSEEEGRYTFEITNGKTPPIAPEENRQSIFYVPIFKPANKFNAKTKPSRSDGG